MSASLASFTEQEIVDLFAAKTGLPAIAGNTRGEKAYAWAVAAVFEWCRRDRRPEVAERHAVEICRALSCAARLEPYVQRQLSVSQQCPQ